MRSPIRRFRAEWLALAVLHLLVVLALAAMLGRERATTQASEGDRLEAATRVIDDNLVLQLEGADRAMVGIRNGLNLASTPIDTAALTEKLQLLTAAMPGFSSMLVLDASGKVIASSRDGLPGRDFSQRDYFDVPRQNPGFATLYVSPPFQSVLGSYVMVLSRVLTDSRGGFAGVVTATLDPAYFSVVLRSVLYAPDMRAGLLHRDGKVFLRMPEGGSAPGTQPPVTPPFFRRYLDAGQFASLSIDDTAIEGTPRIVALRTIDRPDLHLDKPMIVGVGRSRSAIDAPWRARAWQLAALFAAVGVGSVVALRWSQRHRQAFLLIETAVARERQIGAERVELALHGADLGLWDLHVPSRRCIVNARERKLLGYADGDELPQGPAWRELIHPDDRALVDASLLPHAQGQVSTYGCEHRMRHRDGHYLWLSSRGVIVERDAKGAPVRIVGTHLDITERRLAEDRLELATSMLRDSEAELRLVTDHMPALVSLLDLDERFCFANRAYAEWLNLAPSSLIGRSLVEVYGAEAYGTFRHHIARALSGVEVAYERELSTPTGRRQVAFTLVPQVAHDGAVRGFYALATDISVRHDTEQRHARIEERLSLALEGSNLALFDSDLVTGITYQSAQAAKMCGESPVETSRPSTELQRYVHPEDLAALLTRMRDALTGRTPVYNAEFRLKRQGGDWLWVRARGRVVQRDATGRALRLAGTYADINDRKIAERRLRRLAEFDTLTGLPNRALFLDRLQQAMARAARGKPMALLFLDVDHFKTINDTLGHEAGDTLLVVFAERMQAAVRESDTVARLAGDEFTIILEDLHDRGDAEMLAAKLVATLRQPVTLANRQLQVTASIGLTLCVPGESDDAALLRRADLALYEAKRRGRDGHWCAELNAAAAAMEAAAV